MITLDQIKQGIEALELQERCICAHSSLGSFGHVEGGADTVIDAFLESGCTLLVPTFTEGYMVPPPPGYRLQRNGSPWYDGREEPPPASHQIIFTSTDNHVDASMGAIPRAILQRAERVRGNHPHSSFTALGPQAQRLMQGQHRLDWFAPFRTLIELEGQVLLMGVGLNRMTLIHMAEQQAGRVSFRRHVLNAEGEPVEAEVGTCSKGFGQFDPYLLPLARRAEVGSSVWQVFEPEQVLHTAAQAIRQFPHITHCGNPQCERCNDAALGGPTLEV